MEEHNANLSQGDNLPTLITTTPRASINALAYQGIIVSDCYVQIVGTIGRSLGEDAAKLLAEPVANRNEGFIDWYSHHQGPVRSLSDLEAPQAEKVTAVIASRAQAIRDFAESLIATHDPQKVTRGHLLQVALLYPSLNDIYVVGEEPVVTCWGFGPGKMEVNPSNLCELRFQAPVSRETKVSQVNTPKALPSSHFSLAWLWPLLLLLVLLYVLFTDWNGVALFKEHTLFANQFFKSKSCEEVVSLDREIKSLQEKLANLEKEASLHLAKCKPQAPVVKPEVRPVPQAEPVVEKPKEQLVIPEKLENTSFLEGRWLCDTGLINSKTLEPVKVEFSFDKKGQGQGSIFEKNDICRGKAKASIEGSVLHIEHGSLKCQKQDSSYTPNSINCQKNALGNTECFGKNKDGQTWNAVFYKISEP
ncbi:MAG: hypothetical protein IJU40_01690 [Desulfovibrionaceae bacterium]|nr:hypothetical protein [Desulfovibrionaceae bacterium]